MQFVELKNPRVLNLLEEFRYLYTEKYDVPKTNEPLAPEMWAVGQGKKYTSEKYLREVLYLKERHEGYPEYAALYPVKPDHHRSGSREGDSEYRDVFNKLNNKLRLELGVDASALTALYPPEGFIDWHNNANASSFNVIFTWSEKGDGFFKWYDIENDKIITMKDKKGWSCKVGYFAGYDDRLGRPLRYHCAYTRCWRMTLGFMLGRDEEYWEDMIDYIQCED